MTYRISWMLKSRVHRKVLLITAGNAHDNLACIYNHQRHAVGSVIKNEDGS